MELQCIQNLFGITRKACSCFEDDLKVEGRPDDWYTKSSSDYYLDELIGIVSMWQTAKSASCDEKLAEIYLKAYTTALRDTEKEVLMAIHSRLTKADRDFSGFLGTKEFSKSIDVSDNLYAGMYLRMAPIKDGVMYLKKIATMFEQTETFDVYVYKRYISSNTYELVDTIEGIQSTANRYQLNELTEPLILPMYDDTDGELEYFIVYNTTGLTPKNNTPACGMCGRVEAKASYFVSKYGTRGSDIEGLANWSSANGYAYGLALDVDFKCEAQTLICRMFDSLQQWKDAYAGAALLKAGIMVHNLILTSPEVNREKLLGIENTEAQMNVWQTDYEQTLKWLAQNVDANVNDCYLCSSNRLKVTQVLL